MRKYMFFAADGTEVLSYNLVHNLWCTQRQHGSRVAWLNADTVIIQDGDRAKLYELRTVAEQQMAA